MRTMRKKNGPTTNANLENGVLWVVAYMLKQGPSIWTIMWRNKRESNGGGSGVNSVYVFLFCSLLFFVRESGSLEIA